MMRNDEGANPIHSGVAARLNILGAFCGMRDVESLTADDLQKNYGIRQADVMVLFGGSILHGGDVLADAMKRGIARTYLIVGGEGHTTGTLRRTARARCPTIATDGLPEAEVFSRYLLAKYGLAADYLETTSTNCGNNITNMLRLLKDHGVAFHSIILCQDATMQRRMDAGLRRHAPEGTVVINYAAYRATVVCHENRLGYASDIPGMWEIDRYTELLMGEIPRLADNEEGYGPAGKDYIAHVDIPDEVMRAFVELKAQVGDRVREANPLFATKE